MTGVDGIVRDALVREALLDEARYRGLLRNRLLDQGDLLGILDDAEPLADRLRRLDAPVLGDVDQPHVRGVGERMLERELAPAVLRSHLAQGLVHQPPRVLLLVPATDILDGGVAPERSLLDRVRVGDGVVRENVGRNRRVDRCGDVRVHEGHRCALGELLAGDRLQLLDGQLPILLLLGHESS